MKRPILEGLQALDKLDENRIFLKFFYGLYNLNVASRYSLSAGIPGASSAASEPAGSFWTRISAGVSHTGSNCLTLR
jgi:hypothetical protein